MIESQDLSNLLQTVSNVSTFFQKEADDIKKVSRLKYVNFTVTLRMHVHISFRRNYTRTPRVPSSSTEASYRETRTSSGVFNFRKLCFFCGCLITEREKKTKKSCNVSSNKREVDKAVHQTVFDRNVDEWPIELIEKLMGGSLN